MAKKILIDLNFVGTNHLYVVDENNDIQPIRFGVIQDIKFTLDQLLQENDNIQDIYLTGKENYARGFQKELLNDIVKKYSNRNVRIYINDQIFN